MLNADILMYPQKVLLVMDKKPKTKGQADRGLLPSVLSARVSCSMSGDRRVP
jgi:hypothetical protein